MITGRVEEWCKFFCQSHHCEYYLHREYPQDSYCTYPDNCQFMGNQSEDSESEVNTNGDC